MKDLTNVAAIVTGGGSGMGAETARALSILGAKVAIFDKNLDAAMTVANEIQGRAFECDVSDSAGAERALAAARDAHGHARICINCAGIAPAKLMVGREGPMNLDDFAKVIQINLVGTFNIMRLVAADMSTLDPTPSGERGVIINTASVAAYEGQIGQVAYSASKGGIVGMTLPAARELAKFGIRVMTIAPGIMATPMMSAMPINVQENLASSIPFPNRLGRVSEYASLALHIIENEYLNGEVIRLDAGVRMSPK